MVIPPQQDSLPDQDSVMRRAALGLGSLRSSLGEGRLCDLFLVAGVRSFVATHSSRRFVLRLLLNVLGPPYLPRLSSVVPLAHALRRTAPSASVSRAPLSPPPMFVMLLAPLPPPCTAHAVSVRAPHLPSSSRCLPPLYSLLHPSFVGLSCFVGCWPRRESLSVVY